MKKLFTTLYFLSLAAPLSAQQGRTGIDGFEFVAPMQIAVGSDNNFLVDRTKPDEKLFLLSLPPSVQLGVPSFGPQRLDDKVFMLTLPKIAYGHGSRRHEFTATWVPEFEVFKNNGDQNAMNQQAMAMFNYFLKRNIQFTVGDSFTTSKDPARALGNVFLLLPRSPYRENDFQAAVDFQPSRVTNFEVRYDSGWSKFGQTDPFQSQILDSRSSGYTASVTRMLNKNHRIRARYSLYRITPLNQREINDDAVDVKRPFDYPISSVSGEYRVSANPSTTLEFGGGVLHMDTGTSYSVRTSFLRRLGGYWLGGGFTRTLAFQALKEGSFAQGLGSQGFYDVVVVRFRGQPTRNTAIRADLTMSRDVSKRFVETGESLMGRLRLDYRWDERRVLFGTWDSYQQTKNPFVRSPLARNRFMFGMEISLSSEGQRRNSRLNQDALYVALTEHARRRRALEEDD